MSELDKLRKENRVMKEEMMRMREEMKKLKRKEPVFMNGERVANCLDMRTCIGIVGNALRGYADKTYQQPLRFGYRLPLRDKKKMGILASMPAFCSKNTTTPYCSTKVITVFPLNRQLGKHSHQGVIVLFEAKTGELKAIFDATEVTAKRTAAASAVATKMLAAVRSKTLTLIGSGTQAWTHLEAMTIVRPSISQVNIWSRTKSNVDTFVKRARIKFPSIEFVISKDVREACKDADIICTLTSSRVPLVTRDMVKPGAHINAVGSCTPNMRELSSDLVASAKVFTDDREACMKEPGDVVVPLAEGQNIHIYATIGEILLLSSSNDDKGARTSNSEITIFESLGLAIEDLACAIYLYENHCISCDD
jgi:ornithine cyclodeaminase/alanine dehydrogenase-like protein (mu-crystallin family)